MSERSFDTLARGTAEALSRRGSLVTLGGAALAAGLLGAVGTEAKQNPAKKVKKKDKKRCNQARDGCRTLVQSIPIGDEEIRGIFLACCENCRSGDFVECLEASIPVDVMNNVS
jgi:hypothetical protein